MSEFHGDEDSIEIPAYIHEQAVNDIVSVVMKSGQYPITDDPAAIKFDLREYLAENMDEIDLTDVYIDSICLAFRDEVAERRICKERARLERMLTVHIAGSYLAHEVAEQLMDMEEDQ